MVRIEETTNYDDKDLSLIKKLEELPIDFWDFKNCDTSELVHGIHSYPAMMIYPISRNILNILKDIMPIDTLLDPFAGSGTVLVEAMLNNIPNIYGNDLNPLARLISEVKTTLVDKKKLLDIKENFIRNLNLQYKKYNNEILSVDNFIISEKKLDITEKKNLGRKCS